MPFDGCREGPLVCVDHSVRMILRDLKTQSRRLCKPHRDVAEICSSCWFSAVPQGAIIEAAYLAVPSCVHAGTRGTTIRSPYGRHGDRLWVREACRELADGTFVYRADGAHDGPWKNVRFVPKRAARTWLEIDRVEIQRLQAMTEDDAIAEGIELVDGEDPRLTFARAWDQINGKRDGGTHRWQHDPWVWRICFRRVGS